MAKRDGRIPSGWCITDYHTGCPEVFDHGNCSCSCHRGKTPEVNKVSNQFKPFDASKILDYADVTKPSKTTIKDSTPKRRGRPPGSKNKPKNIFQQNTEPAKTGGLSSLIKSMR